MSALGVHGPALRLGSLRCSWQIFICRLVSAISVSLPQTINYIKSSIRPMLGHMRRRSYRDQQVRDITYRNVKRDTSATPADLMLPGYHGERNVEHNFLVARSITSYIRDEWASLQAFWRNSPNEIRMYPSISKFRVHHEMWF